MREVDPSQAAGAGDSAAVSRTATLTQRLSALRPDRTELIDAVALMLVMLVALVGFRTTFDSWRFLAVAAAGVLIGWLSSHLVLAGRGHWLLAVALIPLEYFLLGGPIALRRDLVAGLLPSGRTELDLAHLAVGGWKELLTTLPPLAGDSEYLVLPFLIGLVMTSLGALVAGLNRSPRAILICPSLALAAVILLGSAAPASATAQGLGAAAILIAWVQVRSGRHDRLAGTGTPRLSRVVSALLVSVLALGGAWFVAPRLPGHDTHLRLVLRSYIQPPIEIRQYASPLAAYRKYSSDSDASPLHNQTLLRVEGGQAGDYLRIAVLDDYNGLVWSAAQGSGFQRVGSRLPARGDPTALTITVERDYASQLELLNWVPGLGSATRVGFSGDNARSHEANFFYDLTKGQGLLFDGLRANDVVEVVSVPALVRQPDEALSPGGGAVLVRDDQTDFMSDKLRSLTMGATTPWERLMQVAEAFTQGAWSDGTKDSEMYYLPGHSRGRLTTFMQVTDNRFIGSEEHYVAAFALAANRLGIPARVVFGAVLPADGVVQGRHITPWVEVWTTNGWVVIPPEDYVAPRDRPPDELPPIESTDPSSVYVPPPNPQPQPPRNDNVIDTRAKVSPPEDPALLPASLVLRVLIFSGLGLSGLGALLGLLLLFKWLRRRHRRGRGSYPQRIVGGWYEALDRARDLGRRPPAQATRRELALALGLAPLTGLAAATDRAMFSAAEPDQASVRAYWEQVQRTRRDLLAGTSRGRRLWALANPRSLWPLSKGARGLLGAPPRWEAIRPHAVVDQPRATVVDQTGSAAVDQVDPAVADQVVDQAVIDRSGFGLLDQSALDQAAFGPTAAAPDFDQASFGSLDQAALDQTRSPAVADDATRSQAPAPADDRTDVPPPAVDLTRPQAPVEDLTRPQVPVEDMARPRTEDLARPRSSAEDLTRPQAEDSLNDATIRRPELGGADS